MVKPKKHTRRIALGKGGATGLALEPHGLAIAKYAAGRPKDREFLRAAIDAGLIARDVLSARLAATPRLDAEAQSRIAAQLAADFSRG